MKNEDLFIAYEGKEYDMLDIIAYLRGKATTDQITDYRYFATEDGWVILAKNISNVGQRESDPKKSGKLITVGDYSFKDMVVFENLLKYQSYLPSNIFKYFTNVNMVAFNTEYNEESQGLVGLSCGNKQLYYGYTPNNNELVFSNSEEAIKDLCEMAMQLPNNSFLAKDKISSIGKQLPKADVESLKGNLKESLKAAKKFASKLKDKTVEVSDSYLQKARENYTINEMRNAINNLDSVKSDEYQLIDYLNAIFNSINRITEEDIKVEHEMRLEKKNRD